MCTCSDFHLSLLPSNDVRHCDEFKVIAAEDSDVLTVKLLDVTGVCEALARLHQQRRFAYTIHTRSHTHVSTHTCGVIRTFDESQPLERPPIHQ